MDKKKLIKSNHRVENSLAAYWPCFCNCANCGCQANQNVQSNASGNLSSGNSNVTFGGGFR